MNQQNQFDQFGQNHQTQPVNFEYNPVSPGYPPTPPDNNYPPPESNYTPPGVQQRKWVLPLLFVMFILVAAVLGVEIMRLNGGNSDRSDTLENCAHQWTDATCDSPQKCIKCNSEQGMPLGHLWTPANCQTPSLCERCGATSGEALNHTWSAADCEHPRTCSQCSTTEGAPNGHVWTVANCDLPRTCTVCGKSEGAASGHDWLEATCDRPRTCSICGTTEGMAAGHSWVSATVTSRETCSRCGTTQGSYADMKFIDSGYVQTNSGTVLNLRAEPSTSAKVLTSIPQHTNISLYTSGRSDWYYTYYNGQSGYVSSQYVRFGYYDSAPAGHDSSWNAYVKTKSGAGLYLRSTRSTSGKQLDLIPNGTSLVVYDYQNGWYATYYNGQSGYVSADYIVIS